MAVEKNTKSKSAPETKVSPARKLYPEKKTLIGLFIAAFLVRIISLGRADLWCDEILFVNSAMPPASVGAIFMKHLKNFLIIGHFPFPAMVQNVWLGLAGHWVEDLYHHAWVQRFPAVVWGSLGVPAFFLLVRRVANRRVALIGSAMLCFFYFPVHFAREAYVYAPLVFFGIVSLYYFLRIASEGELKKSTAVPLWISMVLGAYCHMGGTLLMASMLLACVGMILLNRYPVAGDADKIRKGFLRLAAICLAGLATVVPFYYQYLSKPSPHNFAYHVGPFAIMYDVLGKIFLGTSPAAAVWPWVFLIMGLIVVFRDKEQRGVRILLAAVTLILFVIVMVGSSRTLYFSRYFFVVTPGLYALMALGIDAVARRLSRKSENAEKKRALISWGVMVVFLAVHVFLFLPTGYALPAKAVNYGDVARWLEQNLRPGTPYVMESGYELRFVSGFFATPDLVAACPYVHRAGDQEMQVLRQRQAQFMMRFPESAFVESARHGSTGEAYGVWEWPKQFYRKQHIVRNDPLEKLVNWSIWPQINHKEMAPLHISTPIYYNTRRDVEEMMILTGQPVMFTYDQWSVGQIKQFQYARVAQSSWAAVGIRNLRQKAIKGKFVLEAVLGAPEGTYNVVLKCQGKEIGTFDKWGGAFWSLETDEIELKAGAQTLEWGVQGANAQAVQALVMVNLVFRESPPETTGDN